MGKRMGLVAGGVVFLAACSAVPATGYAAGAKYTLSLTKDYTASPWTSEMGYSNRAIGKLGFGIKNLLLGWTDLFIEPREAMKGGDNLAVGIGRGLKDAVENELGGVVHIVTFPITNLDAPLPEGGTQLLQ